jgi:hypothetical protein
MAKPKDPTDFYLWVAVKNVILWYRREMEFDAVEEEGMAKDKSKGKEKMKKKGKKKKPVAS